MEEVIGSIPIRSTNPFNNLDHRIWELGPLRGNSMGTFRFSLPVGSVLRFPAQQKIDGSALRDTLLLHACLGINLHGCADFGMAHQFLNHLRIITGRSKQ
jgi:hypothetical protein